METAIPFVNAGIPVRQQSVLNQLNPGESDGLSSTELKEKFPEEIPKVRENPYRHRYPRAEVKIRLYVYLCIHSASLSISRIMI